MLHFVPFAPLVLTVFLADSAKQKVPGSRREKRCVLLFCFLSVHAEAEPCSPATRRRCAHSELSTCFQTQAIHAGTYHQESGNDSRCGERTEGRCIDLWEQGATSSQPGSIVQSDHANTPKPGQTLLHGRPLIFVAPVVGLRLGFVRAGRRGCSGTAEDFWTSAYL